ncbi:MAG TPA: hypothetical protein VFZ69_17285 [Longimicrobiales bacterium]
MRAVASGGSVAVPVGRAGVEERTGGALRRLGRWWLTHWLRYAEVVGVQWR